MMAGVPSNLKPRVLVVQDRGSAIAAACESAPPGSVILIAGKGHEKFQEIGTEKVPFDDAEHARDALSKK
jgi:UDP-N-acetylmuramoyl-L-alanyl-D-glutamate--2,6-diaminopimelate ligase